jgi:hypothetical protein
VEERLSTLERSLDVTHCLLPILFEQLQARFGEDFLGARLRELVSAETEAQAEAQRLVGQVGALLAQKKSAAAIRLYREVVGGTWEQARRAIKSWGSAPPRAKSRSNRRGPALAPRGRQGGTWSGGRRKVREDQGGEGACGFYGEVTSPNPALQWTAATRRTVLRASASLPREPAAELRR